MKNIFLGIIFIIFLSNILFAMNEIIVYPDIKVKIDNNRPVLDENVIFLAKETFIGNVIKRIVYPLMFHVSGDWSYLGIDGYYHYIKNGRDLFKDNKITDFIVINNNQILFSDLIGGFGIAKI